ncbi:MULTISPECIES: DUF6082 family protein [Streptomyces]|uniref:DUF6082 family protein n=1 Tax=Streptomyces anulatus TaxID=1892 RepID=A0ABZ1ZF83_STRAQ|nr:MULTISPECIES: DUF6082 family protein [Streptomyces]
MKVSTGILLTGVSIVGVGVARVSQEARHQRQRNEATLARNQLDWLAQVSTHLETAATWAPADMEPTAYQAAMGANRLLCMISLRHRLGVISDKHLPHFAQYLMRSPACRAYWKRFSTVREEEATNEGSAKAAAFNAAMKRAYTEAVDAPAGH